MGSAVSVSFYHTRIGISGHLKYVARTAVATGGWLRVSGGTLAAGLGVARPHRGALALVARNSPEQPWQRGAPNVESTLKSF